jgi:hypothetical protein
MNASSTMIYSSGGPWRIAPFLVGSGLQVSWHRICDWVGRADRLDQGAATSQIGHTLFCQVVFRFMTCSLNACLSMAPTRGTSGTKPFIFTISVSVPVTYDPVTRFENSVSMVSTGI